MPAKWPSRQIILQAWIVRKLSKLKAMDAGSCSILDSGSMQAPHDTAVNGLLLSKNLSWMKNLRSRQPPTFHYRMILFNVKAIDRTSSNPSIAESDIPH
jgi:hypothetical protein